MDDIEAKLTRARTKLILDKPFLGALVLRLPLQKAKADWCPTTHTDAKKFYYNEAWIKDLTPEQTQFALAAEALHCALSHFARRGHRLKKKWDAACDYAVTPMLVDDGLKPYPHALYEPVFAGMTAEEIYPVLDDQTDEQQQDDSADSDSEQGGSNGQNQDKNPADTDKQPPEEQDSPEQQDGDDGEGQSQQEPQNSGQNQEPEPQPDENESGDGQSESAAASQPPPLNRDEMEALQVQWQQRLAGAAQMAMQAGKLGGEMARMIDHFLQPQLPWRMLLARYMTASARDDYSWMRPSRREGQAIMPSLRSSEVEVTVALDTSGSINRMELDAFVSEVNAIKGQMRARITLLACDASVSEQSPWVYEPWEPLTLPENLQGGGGTDFRPVFEWVNRQDRRTDLLLYFTDADGPFPEQEPTFPTLWLVKGKKPIPWGQRVQLN